MAVDDRGSYGDSDPPFTTHDACGKFVDLLPVLPVVVSLSGTVSTCDAVISEFYEQLKTFKEEQDGKGETLQLDHLSVGIRNARQYEYLKFLRQEMQGYLGMTLEQWQEETNPERRRKGWAVARAARLNFPVWLLAGGFWGTAFGLVKSSGACVTEMGARHFAVGCGDLAALRKLHSRRQEPYMSAPRTLLHVAEAMNAAKRAYPNLIGKAADYVILRRDKPIMRFPAASGPLDDWRRCFRGKPTDPMQDDSGFRKEFEAQLYEHESVNR
jgi:hypothetical protein